MAVQVDLVAVAAVKEQLQAIKQAAQEYFTFSTRR